MSFRPVSEKVVEILFNRFLLQSFPLGGVQLFAPTSVEERQLGYDARVVGFSSFREIYLQFKAPVYSHSSALFTVSTTPHQHDILKKYEPRGAYYVAPMFRSLAELNKAQKSLQTAADFLKHFVCIEVAPLPTRVNFFHYVQPSSHRESPHVKFKTPADGHRRIATHPVTGDGWLRGSTLLAKFRTGEVGVHRDLIKGDADVVGKLTEGTRFDGIEDAAERMWGVEDGVLVRIPIG